MLFKSMRAAVSAQALVLALGAPAFAQAAPDDPLLAPAADDAPLDQRNTVVVTGRLNSAELPTTSETRTAEEIEATTSVINAEDALRYFPNILVRKRHVGDTQAPITTRTSGVGASARSLIYADGVLLSALIGNNNSNASPKWGMISPDEIASVSVLYGPFSAAYAGNSIGAVVEIETRMPEDFEASAGLTGSLQAFDQYATSGNFGAAQASLMVGNRFGPLAFRLSATHTDSDSQPLAYVTATEPACNPATVPLPAGCVRAIDPVLSGAISTYNRTGAPIIVLGAGGLEHQVQDNVTLKAAWDIDANTRLAYSIGRFGNDTNSGVETYLRDASGAEVFAGGPFTIGNRRYTIAATSFSNNVYDFQEEQWSNSLSLDWHSPDDTLEGRVVATIYDYATSEQRIPSGAMPGALTGGAGSIARMDGTGWQTLDAEGTWRPQGREGAHAISFGLHSDRYELVNERFATTNWIDGDAGALSTAARGKTQAMALWAQDAWKINDTLTLIAGGRLESWKGKDGFNYSLAPLQTVQQPEVEKTTFSPKASLTWDFAKDLSLKGSIGKAYRFPTVGELYQLVTVGAQVISPNPNLRPEDALSTELSLTRRYDDGEIRVSLFTEDLKDAIISQTALIDPLTASPPQPAGTVITASFIQNIDKVESRGIEIVAEKDNVWIDGLSLSGSLTYLDSTTAQNAANPAAVGKQTPQVPQWRSTLVATYSPTDQLSFTLAGRYVDRVYGTIDNSDSVSHTFQGFEGFATFDVRATYRFDEHWSGALGIENFANGDYFLFHPFPQRTGTAELKYRY